MCLFVHNPIQYVYVGEQKLCLSRKEFSYQTIYIYIYIYINYVKAIPCLWFGFV